MGVTQPGGTSYCRTLTDLGSSTAKGPLKTSVICALSCAVAAYGCAPTNANAPSTVSTAEIILDMSSLHSLSGRVTRGEGPRMIRTTRDHCAHGTKCTVRTVCESVSGRAGPPPLLAWDACVVRPRALHRAEAPPHAGRSGGGFRV